MVRFELLLHLTLEISSNLHIVKFKIKIIVFSIVKKGFFCTKNLTLKNPLKQYILLCHSIVHKQLKVHRFCHSHRVTTAPPPTTPWATGNYDLLEDIKSHKIHLNCGA